MASCFPRCRRGARPALRRGRASGRSGAPGDEGITSLELAILYPVILLIILGMFQISLYWHTANTAEAAASRGVDVGKVDVGDNAAAEAEAVAAATQLLDAATRLDNPSVSAQIAGDTIIVTVAADAPRLFGPGSWRVQSVVEGRLERFIPADER